MYTNAFVLFQKCFCSQFVPSILFGDLKSEWLTGKLWDSELILSVFFFLLVEKLEYGYINALQSITLDVFIEYCIHDFMSMFLSFFLG